MYSLLFGLLAMASNWSPEALFQVRSPDSVEVSPDGTQLAYTVVEANLEEDWYDVTIHVASAEGGDTYRLTSPEVNSFSPSWSPDGRSIAFLSTRSGATNLWLIRLGRGEPDRLTDIEHGIASYSWSPDGSHIAYTACDRHEHSRDPHVVDEEECHTTLWLSDLKGETQRLLGEGTHIACHFSWSPNGSHIACTVLPSTLPFDFFSGRLAIVTIDELDVKLLDMGRVGQHSPVWSPDARSIAYIQQDDAGYLRTLGSSVFLYDVESASSTFLTQTYNGDPILAGWPASGLYIADKCGTRTELYRIHEDLQSIVPLHAPVCHSYHFNQAGTHLGFVGEGLTQPPEVWVTDLSSCSETQVSDLNIDLPPLPHTEVISWQADDGTQIEGLLTYPDSYERGNRYPLTLMIHGGPSGNFIESHFANPQYAPEPVAPMAQSGQFVLRCNIRGSDGYGKDFRTAIFRDWGGRDFYDLMAGVDYVIDLGLADPDNLFVSGWSYGGYMTATAVTKTDRFKAAIMGAGVSNLLSMTGTSDIPELLPGYLGTELWDDPYSYMAHSPIMHVGRVKTPTMILHGECDQRVPISQGYEFYSALKRRGIKTKMVVYPGEGHSPSSPQFQLDIVKRFLDWFSVDAPEPSSAR